MRTKIRQRNSKVKKGTYRRSRKWDATKLQNPNIRNKCEKNITQKSNEIDQSRDIELEWDNLKNILNYVAFDEVGIRINTKKM